MPGTQLVPRVIAAMILTSCNLQPSREKCTSNHKSRKFYERVLKTLETYRSLGWESARESISIKRRRIRKKSWIGCGEILRQRYYLVHMIAVGFPGSSTLQIHNK